MRRELVVAGSLAFALLTTSGSGQYGSAISGSYPVNYSGATFTGEIKSVDADRDELTLLYWDAKKKEEFVGRLEAPCEVPPLDSKAAKRTIRAADMALGTKLVAYYRVVTRKEKDRKWKENAIIAVRPFEVAGQRIPWEKQVTSFCTQESAFVYRAWGQEQ